MMSTETNTQEQKPAAPAPVETGQDKRIAELSHESATYRTQRNEAVRRAHAYETMLKAHGVDLSGVTVDKLNAMPINAGRVEGQFDYTPPKIEVPKNAAINQRAEGAATLTLEQVENWPREEINRRWPEVKALLEAAGKG